MESRTPDPCSVRCQAFVRLAHMRQRQFLSGALQYGKFSVVAYPLLLGHI